MGRIAFYAPMKSPTHPTPSGDREMARNLMAAIAAGTPWPVDLISDFRIHDTGGDAGRQAQLTAQSKALLPDIIDQLQGSKTRLWVTYHNYYKAPDLLGPAVCAALNLPYIQIESSRAKSRLAGPWASFAAAAEAASDAADLIFYPTALDLITLDRDRVAGQSLVKLPPFLPTDVLPALASVARPNRPILAAGMMRHRDKLQSYQIIAETLSHVTTSDWALQVVGDGPARTEVEAALAPFAPHVTFLGERSRTEMTQAYQDACVFLWPGVNEAYGMVYLEAQAAGLPVVAQDREGVRDVLAPGPRPTPKAGPKALAVQMDALLQNPDLRRAQGADARAHVEAHHLQPAATQTFWTAVGPLLESVS